MFRRAGRLSRTFAVSALAFLAACASGGVPAPKSIATGQSRPMHLAVDLGFVYWTSQSGSATTIMKIAKEQGVPVVVATVPGAGVSSIALDDENLYWIAPHPGGGQLADVIVGTSKHKKAPTKVVVRSKIAVTSMALDATHMYFTQAGDARDVDEWSTPGVFRLMVGRGSPGPLVTRQPGVPTNVVLNGTHVFWVNAHTGKQYTVMAAKKSGGEPRKLAEVPDTETAGVVPALAADDTGVYYRTSDAVWKVFQEVGTPTRVAKVPISNASYLAIDARALYFEGSDSVMRVSLAGGRPSDVARGVGGSVAVDDRAVYWLTGDGVMMATK
jgi:hypothetical protein